MRTLVYTVHQTLTPRLLQFRSNIQPAKRRGHSQATLTSFGRQIAHHSLHFRALEPCFNVILNRLPPIQTLSFRLNPRSPTLWSQLWGEHMRIRGDGMRSSSRANKTSRSWRLPVDTFSSCSFPGLSFLSFSTALSQSLMHSSYWIKHIHIRFNLVPSKLSYCIKHDHV